MTRPYHLQHRIINIALLASVLCLGAVTYVVFDGNKGVLEYKASAPDLSRIDLRQRAAMITSTFENSTTTLQYGYAENINDGRGITAGRAGFTSGTGDMLIVIERYTVIKPDNLLAAYISPFAVIKGESTEGLAGLEAAWQKEALDPRFRGVQDEVVDELYFKPTYAMAQKYGIRTALGQAMVWDNCILTGCDYSGNSTGNTLEKTKRAADKDAQHNEAEWLDIFLTKALNEMLYYNEDGATLDPQASRSRIAAWRSLLQLKKFNLQPPLNWKAYGSTCVIKPDGTGGGTCR